MKEFVREIKPHVRLYRDSVTGIAWIEDGSTGLGYSCHPNIDKSGSVIGMKQRGYWSKFDKIVQSHGWKYNISRLVVSDKLDKIAADECRCQECLKRKDDNYEKAI